MIGSPHLLSSFFGLLLSTVKGLTSHSDMTEGLIRMSGQNYIVLSIMSYPQILSSREFKSCETHPSPSSPSRHSQHQWQTEQQSHQDQPRDLVQESPREDQVCK